MLTYYRPYRLSQAVNRLFDESVTNPQLLSPEAAEFSHYPGGHAEGFPDAFKQLDLAFYSFIASGCKGEANFPTFADGDREVRICEAIAQSAKERKWVNVSS